MDHRAEACLCAAMATRGAQDAFVHACYVGNLEAAKANLKALGVHVDHADSCSYTALEKACIRGHLHVVVWLLEETHAANKSIALPIGDDTMPIAYACYYGQLSIAKYLYARGADVRARNHNDITPFWSACFKGHLRVAQWLVRCVGVGGDVTRAPRRGQFAGKTPLMVAGLHRGINIETWLLYSVLQRRSLIAYWGAGRDRKRRGRSGPGVTATAAVWRSLPRQAMAEVLMMLG